MERMCAEACGVTGTRSGDKMIDAENAVEYLKNTVAIEKFLMCGERCINC